MEKVNIMLVVFQYSDHLVRIKGMSSTVATEQSKKSSRNRNKKGNRRLKKA